MPLSPTLVQSEETRNAITKALMAQESEDREICLLSITHDSFANSDLPDGILRLSTDATTHLWDDEETLTPIYGTISNNKQYVYLPISATLPASTSETPPTASFSISNVSRYVAPYLLQITDQFPKLTIDVVLASNTDLIIQSWPTFDINNMSITADTLSVQIGLNIASSEPTPWLRFTPHAFPNVFD